MNTNNAGIALIRSFEGCRLTAYPDPGTGGKPYTVGYGHTGPEVALGLKITQSQADAFLVADLAKFERAVDQLVTVSLTENEHAALVSFAYNCGPTNLKNSTLLRKLNAGDRSGAADQFGAWNRANGKVLAGLTRRRAAEKALFLTPVLEAAPVAPTAPVSTEPTITTQPQATGLVAKLFGLLASIRKA